MTEEANAGTNKIVQCERVRTGDQGASPAWSVEVADAYLEASGGCTWQVIDFEMACNVVNDMHIR